MLRTINFLIFLLGVSLVSAATLPRDVLEAPRPIIKGPTYRYILKDSHNPALCAHMLHVFNTKFAHLWDAPPIWASEGDPVYSARSVYAFPMLPHLKHDSESTFLLRYSKVPTSKEFSAIPWQEGRALMGGCPRGGTCPSDNIPIPILVAHFDFDNDGRVDTVVQEGYSTGYPWAPSQQGGAGVYLIVWRSQMLTISDTPSLWALTHPSTKSLTPITLDGPYLRPFVYRRKVFVASYETDSPSQEHMFVKSYSFTGRKQDITGRPEWTATSICDFRMKQIRAR